MQFTSLPKAWNTSHTRAHTHRQQKCPVDVLTQGCSAFCSGLLLQAWGQRRAHSAHMIGMVARLNLVLTQARETLHAHFLTACYQLPALNNRHCSLLYTPLKDQRGAQKRANEGGKEGDTNVIFSIGADLWLALFHHFLRQAGRTRLDSSGQTGGWRVKQQGHGWDEEQSRSFRTEPTGAREGQKRKKG